MREMREMNKFNKGDTVTLTGTTNYIVIEPKFNELSGYDDHVELETEVGDGFNGHRIFAANVNLTMVAKAEQLAA